MSFLALLALAQFSLASPEAAWDAGAWVASPATCSALGTWPAPATAYVLCDLAADLSEDRGYVVLLTKGE